VHKLVAINRIQAQGEARESNNMRTIKMNKATLRIGVHLRNFNNAGAAFTRSRRRWLRPVCLSTGAWAALLLLGVLPACAADNALESISFLTLPGDQVQLSLMFNHTPPEPLTFTIDNPPPSCWTFPTPPAG
jgi:hypothetical protein